MQRVSIILICIAAVVLAITLFTRVKPVTDHSSQINYLEQTNALLRKQDSLLALVHSQLDSAIAQGHKKDSALVLQLAQVEQRIQKRLKSYEALSRIDTLRGTALYDAYLNYRPE